MSIVERGKLAFQVVAGRFRYVGMSYVAAGAVISAGGLAVLLTATPVGQALQEAAGGVAQAFAGLATASDSPASSATPAFVVTMTLLPYLAKL